MEVTEEIIDAIWACAEMDRSEAVAAAHKVMAIVERDNVIHVRPDRECQDAGPFDVACSLEPDHEGRHIGHQYQAVQW